jgi:hypothetical protein
MQHHEMMVRKMQNNPKIRDGDDKNYRASSSAKVDDFNQQKANKIHAEQHYSTGSDPITPADIGAETPEGAQSKVNTVQDIVNNHMEDKSNPHSVTTEQIGAYTTEQVNILLSSKADANNYPVDIKLRKNGTSLQVSLDGGATWKTVTLI